MTGEEIIRRIQEYLEQHRQGTRGHITQDPYKEDIFKLFREAYEGGYFNIGSNPRLTGDAIRDILNERWIKSLEMQDRMAAADILERLLSMWSEWKYAWDKYQE